MNERNEVNEMKLEMEMFWPPFELFRFPICSSAVSHSLYSFKWMKTDQWVLFGHQCVIVDSFRIISVQFFNINVNITIIIIIIIYIQLHTYKMRASYALYHYQHTHIQTYTHMEWTLHEHRAGHMAETHLRGEPMKRDITFFPNKHRNSFPYAII